MADPLTKLLDAEINIMTVLHRIVSMAQVAAIEGDIADFSPSYAVALFLEQTERRTAAGEQSPALQAVRELLDGIGAP